LGGPRLPRRLLAVPAPASYTLGHRPWFKFRLMEDRQQTLLAARRVLAQRLASLERAGVQQIRQAPALPAQPEPPSVAPHTQDQPEPAPGPRLTETSMPRTKSG